MTGPGDYFLGLPAWAFPGWSGRYFTDKPSRLASYADVFNAVEGNTTFYRIPDPATIASWHDAVGGDESRFRFSFKLPREVTHERRPDWRMLERFLDVTEPLAPVSGPLLVQLPSTIGQGRLAFIDELLAALEGRRRAVVEVRDPDLFERPDALLQILDAYGAGRVVLDSRPLYEGDREHPDVLAALHKKPDLPVDPAVSNGIAFVRLILHPDIASNRRYIDEWAGHVAGYIADGIETIMMIHCPNNLYCPPLALDFHETLRREVEDLDALPAWPVPEQFSLV